MGGRESGRREGKEEVCVEEDRAGEGRKREDKDKHCQQKEHWTT